MKISERFKTIKIIGLVQEWFRAPFPPGWGEEKQIESYGQLVQKIEDIIDSIAGQRSEENMGTESPRRTERGG